jgi:hypothetical protein
MATLVATFLVVMSTNPIPGFSLGRHLCLILTLSRSSHISSVTSMSPSWIYFTNWKSFVSITASKDLIISLTGQLHPQISQQVGSSNVPHPMLEL